jgi:predicted RNA-binding protein (virulence factor B family)
VASAFCFLPLAQIIKIVMVKTGDYNTLRVLRKVDFGVYLDDGEAGILLPKRYVPEGLNEGDDIEVFVYHDGEDRLIATTDKPFGVVGDILKMKAVSVTEQGAFMEWGIMKDLFVPKSKQIQGMLPKGEYLVKIYRDDQTGRAAASERVEEFLHNDVITVKEGDEVDLIVLRRTDIGYLMIVNNVHTGVLHMNEVFRPIGEGDKFKGFVKKVTHDNKIDVVAGKMGYSRVEGEAEKVLRLLKENNGFLPYHDKSDPEEIYLFFAMSKKTFKMTTGNLYRERKISFEEEGIRLSKV